MVQSASSDSSMCDSSGEDSLRRRGGGGDEGNGYDKQGSERNEPMAVLTFMLVVRWSSTHH